MIQAARYEAATSFRRNLWPAVGAVAFFLALFAMRFDQMLDWSPPIEFLGGEAVPPVVDITQPIRLIRYGIVNRACKGHVYRQVIDAKQYVHTILATPSLTAQAIPSRGEVQKLVGRSFHLPAAMKGALGPTIFRTKIDYICPWLGMDNPLQRIWPITVNLPDIRFDVIGPP